MTDPDIQPSASGETPPAEVLRQVADEVRSAFPRPVSAPELVLIDVDPRRLHAFWTLSPPTLDTARREFGPDAERAPMVLRVHQITPSGATAASFDVEVLGLQGQRYVDVVGENRLYRGELGLLRSDGSLVSLAVSADAELPRLGPAGEGAEVTPAKMPGVPERTTEQAPPRPPSEPVSHPFPLPPSEPSDFVPHHLAPHVGAGDIIAAQLGAHRKTSRNEQATLSAGKPDPLAPIWQVPPEPVHHPFPLPPSEPSEFDPALTGAFPPVLEAGSEAAMPRIASETPHAADQARHEAQPPHETHAPVSPAAEAPSESEGQPSEPLPLENVLTLSSYALGREAVLFEINAELHVFGRARPGAQLQLFGRKVRLRPDGTFLVIQPLPSGALVLSSLLVGDDARPLSE
jgi:hypothetical protein